MTTKTTPPTYDPSNMTDQIAIGTPATARRLSRVTIADGRPHGCHVRRDQDGRLQWASRSRPGGTDIHGWVSSRWADSH